MAQEQNYQVNYSINVDASQGTKQVIAFGEAVGKLVQAKASLPPAVTNIKNMMDEIDRVFRTKNGKKRNFDYRLTIDTKKSEEKLERIKGLLTDISTLSKGISLTINACGKDFLTVNVIPDTQKRTTMLHWRPGSRVKMETDLIGKYVRRIMQCQADGPATPQKSSGINKEFLLQNGFL